MSNTKSKLIRVYCGIRHTSRGTIHRYIGHFEDGTRRQLRESFNPYVSVAQVVYPGRDVTLITGTSYRVNAKEEFLFSSKPSVKLSPRQRECVISEVAIGLDTAEGR
jgi:hypothetical protein